MDERSDTLELDHRLPPDLAAEAAREIRRQTGTATTVTLGEPGARRRALSGSQEAELDGVTGVTSPAAGAQVRGALAWGAALAVAGAVVGLLVGLIPMFGLALGPRLLIWAIAGLAAGSAAGLVYGGGREPELEGVLRDTSTDVTVAVVTTDEAAAALAERILGDAEREVVRRARHLAEQDRPETRL